MTPAMESVLRAMQRIEAAEAKLDTIRIAAAMGSNHEVAVALHHLERRHQMVSCRETVENGKKCALWALTGIGMKWLLGPTAGNTGTVADLVQEIKAEQDAAIALGNARILGDSRVAIVDEILASTEARLAEFGQKPGAGTQAESPRHKATPLTLTIRDDGTLLIVADGGLVHLALTAGQTSQLGRFLKGTAGVWECPFSFHD